MDDPPLLDYVHERPFNWILGALAVVVLVTLVEVLRSVIVDKEAVQIGLIAVLMIGVAAFAYKSEVRRQEDEIERMQRTGLSREYRPEKLPSDDEAALAKGLRAALRQPGPADYVIRKLRK